MGSINAGKIYSARMLWEMRRAAQLLQFKLMRRWGVFEAALSVCLICAISAGFILEHKHSQLWQLQAQRASQTQTRLLARAHQQPQHNEAHARLKAFEDYLPASEDLPIMIADLMNLAESQKLTILRTEYQTQIDTPGKFLRYQMSLPVKGDPQAIYRYLQAALYTQKTLALESAQFKRESSGALLEARIRWTILTRLPQLSQEATSSPVSSGNSPRQEQP